MLVCFILKQLKSIPMNKFNTLSIKRIFITVSNPYIFYFFNSAILSVFKQVEVLRTTDGVMLLSLIESSALPDIIFLDVNMPFKNGICCLKTIRSDEKYKSTKMVMFSSMNYTNDIDNCYDNGADFYFIGPAGFSSFVQQLKNLIANDDFINNIRPARQNFVINNNYTLC